MGFLRTAIIRDQCNVIRNATKTRFYIFSQLMGLQKIIFVPF